MEEVSRLAEYMHCISRRCSREWAEFNRCMDACRRQRLPERLLTECGLIEREWHRCVDECTRRGRSLRECLEQCSFIYRKKEECERRVAREVSSKCKYEVCREQLAKLSDCLQECLVEIGTRVL